MDGKIARAHDRDLEAGESCSALVNVDSSLFRRHRSLRNQLCLTRTAVAFLLLVCMSLGAVIYIQHCAASKNNDNNEGLKEKQQMERTQNAIVDPTKNLNFTTFTMSKPAHCKSKPQPDVGFIAWEKVPKMSPNFDLTENNMSVIFHRSGWYQITLQITYQQIKSLEKQRELIHYLVRNSDNYANTDETLLSVYDIAPKINDRKKSVHSAKLVQIQAGDRLKVKSESMQHLHCESQYVGTANFLMAQLIHATM